MTQPYLTGLLQIRATFSGQRPGYVHENVTYWTYSGTPPLTLANLTAIQGVFDPAFSTMWKQGAASTWHYTGSILTDRSSDTGLQVTNLGYSAVAGLASPPAAGEQVCMLISLKDTTRYKGGHGRWYLPGFATGVMTDDATFGSTIVGTVNTDIATLLSDMFAISSANGGPVVPAVLHARRSKPTVIPPYMIEPSALIVNSLAATQRRRIRKAPHR